MTGKHTTARRHTTAARRSDDAPSARSGTLLRFDGRRILDPDGIVLAVLGDDDRWQTGDGVPCHGLEIPAPKAQPQVHAEDRAAATRAADSVWMEGALETIARLAATQEMMTADDVWAELQMPPREPRMIGNALDRARGLGLIEATDEHRPSKRKNNNHSRPIRVWRSLTPEQTRLC